jgi:hypothetical protein
MKGQAARDPARGRDDVNVRVAVVLARESDPSAVGRKDGAGFDADAVRKSRRVTALTADDPQIAGIDKDYMAPAQGRPLQQRGAAALRRRRGCCSKQQHEHKGHSFHAIYLLKFRPDTVLNML